MRSEAARGRLRSFYDARWGICPAKGEGNRCVGRQGGLVCRERNPLDIYDIFSLWLGRIREREKGRQLEKQEGKEYAGEEERQEGPCTA